MVERLADDLSNQGFKITVLTFGHQDGEKRSYEVVKAKEKVAFFINMFKFGKNTDVIYTFDLYTAGFLSWFIGKLILRKKLVVIR